MAPKPEEDRFLSQLGRTFFGAVAGFEKQTGVHHVRWLILQKLEEAQSSSQHALARKCRMGPASVSRILRELEAMGYVTREIDPQDSRQSVVALSAKGREFVRETAAKREQYLRKALKGLASEDVIRLETALKAIEKNTVRLR
jgi:DNA-binding MarR family transcriptional regulator